MAVSLPRTGFSEDGLSILNPTAFIEDILLNKLYKIGLFRKPNSPTVLSRETNIPNNLINFPNIEQTYSPNFSGMLDEQISMNQKTYLQIPNFGSFIRLSANGNNNNCWFDSFLTCMSPKYRSLSLHQRQSILPSFRNWCNKNKTDILSEKPSYIKPFFTDDQFIHDIETPTIEIEMFTGFLIAWYFGVNIIYIKFEPTGPVIDGTMSIQSPECKTIFMIHLGGTGAGAHYEPVGILGLNNNQTLNEATSTFLFDWTDQRICQMPNLPTTWSLPKCLGNNSGSVERAVGGKRRRMANYRHRRTKKRVGKKRRTTHRH